MSGPINSTPRDSSPDAKAGARKAVKIAEPLIPTAQGLKVKKRNDFSNRRWCAPKLRTNGSNCGTWK
jgi:hypothetical protein